MRSYLISLVVGTAVGLIYGLIGVRSPAPPVIALIGLLGMLAGEQVVPVVRSHVLKSEVRAGSTPSEQTRVDTSTHPRQ